MRCPKCGVTQPAGVKFCMECGARMPAENDSAPNVPYQPPEPPRGAPIPPHPAAPVCPAPDTSRPADAPAQPKMKWYKFLIHCSLWLGMLGDLGDAASLLTGADYDGDLSLLYAYLPGLRALNVTYAILSLGMAVFCVYVRSRLANFRRNGPTCFLVLIGLNIGLPVAFALLESILFGTPLSEGISFLVLLMMLFFFYLNLIYFRKRAYLFVH